MFWSDVAVSWTSSIISVVNRFMQTQSVSKTGIMLYLATQLETACLMSFELQTLFCPGAIRIEE